MANVSPTERTLDIIELLADHPRGLAISEIARRLELPKSIAHRLISILVDRKFAIQDASSQHYRLAIRAAALGLRFFGTIGLNELCQPIIDRLAHSTGEFVRVCAAENDELVWISRAQGSSEGLRYDPTMESGPALHATANGRAWLATLEREDALFQVRQRSFNLPPNYARSHVRTEQELSNELKRIKKTGYAVSSDESVIGITALAAPIPDRDGGCAVGCVSVAGPTVRMPSSRWKTIAPEMIAAATEISEIWPIPRMPKRVKVSST